MIYFLLIIVMLFTYNIIGMDIFFKRPAGTVASFVLPRRFRDAVVVLYRSSFTLVSEMPGGRVFTDWDFGGVSSPVSERWIILFAAVRYYGSRPFGCSQAIVSKVS